MLKNEDCAWRGDSKVISDKEQKCQSMLRIRKYSTIFSAYFLTKKMMRTLNCFSMRLGHIMKIKRVHMFH